ncbi:sulfurtransferase complex subunit TusB [Leucothrix sargassi]|nr:sulfurtransferase complex subunit TusB [Leucothrix sargassi]
MAMLHIVNKSPFEKASLESCLKHVSQDDQVLMIEDAVVGAVQNTSVSSQIENALKVCSVSVLSPDLVARGLSGKELIDGVALVDYDGFVDLTVACDSTQSWL